MTFAGELFRWHSKCRIVMWEKYKKAKFIFKIINARNFLVQLIGICHNIGDGDGYCWHTNMDYLTVLAHVLAEIRHIHSSPIHRIKMHNFNRLKSVWKENLNVTKNLPLGAFFKPCSWRYPYHELTLLHRFPHGHQNLPQTRSSSA